MIKLENIRLDTICRNLAAKILKPGMIIEAIRDNHDIFKSGDKFKVIDNSNRGFGVAWVDIINNKGSQSGCDPRFFRAAD